MRRLLNTSILPRLRRQNIVHILDLLIPPNLLMAPPQRLERIIHIRQRPPPPRKHIRDERLVGKPILIRLFRIQQRRGDELVVCERRAHDLQPAVALADPRRGRRALGLCGVRVAVLVREAAVGWDPVGGVEGDLERVADAGVRCGEDVVRKGHVHEFVHVLEDEHVGVELDHALVLDEREGLELACCPFTV